jgi:hypothetical protein
VRGWYLVIVFCGGKPVFPVPFVKKVIFSPMHILGTFVKNQMAVVVWVFYYISLVFMSMSVFVPTPCYFYYFDSAI